MKIDLEQLESLLILKQLVDVDRSALDDYTGEVREKLDKLFEVRVDTVVLKEGGEEGQQKRGRKSNAPTLSEEQTGEIEQEAMELLKELKDLKAAGKLDTDTKIQVIKAKTALIEKVVNIQERFYNVRKVAHFQKVVIDILTDLVPEDDRSVMMERLEPYL